MRYGRLDRQITIQRKTVTQSASGDPVETWATLARRWASMDKLSGDERFNAPQILAQQQTEFQVRWSGDLAGLSPLDRIVYPALADASPEPTPTAGSIYDVLAVHEIGRREGLQIVAVRRADA
jgi:head-tail adaptor